MSIMTRMYYVPNSLLHNYVVGEEEEDKVLLSSECGMGKRNIENFSNDSHIQLLAS